MTPPKFDETAAVAPTTVTEISEGKHGKPKPKRKSPTRKNHPVKHTAIDIRVWKKAMELAKGDKSRLEVRGPTEIIIHNPGWKPK